MNQNKCTLWAKFELESIRAISILNFNVVVRLCMRTQIVKLIFKRKRKII